MKKLGLLLVIVLTIALTLCACAPAAPTNENEAPTTLDAQSTPLGPEDGKMYTIGLTQIADHPSLDNCREGFLAGLAEGGFVEGENLTVLFNSAQGETAIASTIAQTFVSRKVDLIGAIATPSAVTCYAAAQGTGIPVIFTAVSDPVEAQLVPAFGEAGDNTTGVSDLIPVEKQLAMIRAMLPNAKSIGILYNLSEQNSVSQIAAYQEAAADFGFTIESLGVTSAAEVPLGAETLASKVDCMNNLTDNLIVGNLSILLAKANEKGIPVFGSEEEQVKNGCLASEGLDYIALGKQTGQMAAKVLSGYDIASIGTSYVEECHLTVNQSVLDALGLTLPEELAQRATIVE